MRALLIAGLFLAAFARPGCRTPTRCQVQAIPGQDILFAPGPARQPPIPVLSPLPPLSHERLCVVRPLQILSAVCVLGSVRLRAEGLALGQPALSRNRNDPDLKQKVARILRSDQDTSQLRRASGTMCSRSTGRPCSAAAGLSHRKSAVRHDSTVAAIAPIEVS